MNLDHVTADLRSWRLLPGLSGATVVLGTRDGDRWTVRKVAPTGDAGPRLKRQADKQARFAADPTLPIRTPAVLDEGETEGCYYFEMPFVVGTDAPTYLRRASYTEVAAFADRLESVIRAFAGRDAVVPGAPTTMFDAQYDRLRRVCQEVPGLSREVLDPLFAALERLREIPGLDATVCHGDLTLENLIVDHSGDLWAIDLLDAPYEHYWNDLAKVHQDLQGGWYLRNHPPIARAVLGHVARRLRALATELDASYDRVHDVLVAMTFVRILPYTTEATDRDFVVERIAHFAALANRDPDR